MRRAPERSRMRLWKFFQREREGICRARRRVKRPGPAFGLVLLAIRRPSTRTMRTRIAALSPKDAVAVPSLAATAACLATWAGGLLFGDDGVTGLRFRHARGCLPRSRDHLGRHDSFGFDQGLLLSRRAPRAFRRSREAAALPCSMPMPPVLTGRSMAHPSIRRPGLAAPAARLGRPRRRAAPTVRPGAASPPTS